MLTTITSAGRPLDVLVDLPQRPGPWPVVVVVHGFKGFMEWGFFPPLAELLASRGLAVVRCNLSGSGMRPGDELVTDPRAFRDDTYTRELEDVEGVLTAVNDGAFAGAEHCDRSRVALLGHSRGGAIALLAAARSPSLRALVTWNAISTIARHRPEELEVWRERGELPVVNGRTGQVLALGPALLAEVENPPSHLDLHAAAAARRCPWLLVHGASDTTVPPHEAHDLAAVAAAPCELLLVRDGDHTFGARHPFVGPTAPLVRCFNATQRFLLRELR